MTDDDACSIVKADLEAGSFTRFTDDLVIKVLGKEKYPVGKVNYAIFLKNPRRIPVQGQSGSIIFTKKQCTIEIRARTAGKKDDIYDDVIDVLNATSRNYVLMRGIDFHDNRNINRMEFDVEVWN